MALELLKSNQAADYLKLASQNINKKCVFLNITNEEKGFGFCREYKFRPFVCRIFGIASRLDKYNEKQLLICPTLKENNLENDLKNIEELPLVELWKKKLEIIDPKLSEKELPINQALIFILEKVLFLEHLTTI